MRFPDEICGFGRDESRLAFGLIGLLFLLLFILLMALVLDPSTSRFYEIPDASVLATTIARAPA